MSIEFQPSTQGLRGIELLDGLPTERLEALARDCRWRRYDAGQQIIARNGADRDVFLVIAGRVRVTIYAAGGRQVTFHDEARGAILGDMAAIDDGPRSADAVALESVLAASLSAVSFNQLLAQEPAVAQRYMRRLTGLVRALSERVIDLSTQGVGSRIQCELLRLARLGAVQGNVARISPAPRYTDIASQVSTYREQVTRELSALNKAGLLAREDGALVIKDLSRLQRLVEEGRS
jgi:CRP/FNR family cyclic AMP-dependent transcriptional regulator